MSLCPLDPWIAGLCGLSGGVPRPEGVRNWQMGALRRVLRLAAERSLLYRERFSGLPPALRQAIRTGIWPERPEDLTLLPFTLPEDLAGEGWRRLLCVSQDEIARMVTLHTSGTTESLSGGAGVKRLAFSERDLARTVDFFAIGMGVLARPGDAVLVLLPGAERPGGVADLLIRGLARLGVGCAGDPFVPPPYPPVCRGVPGSGQADPQGFAAALRRERPACVVAAPSQLAGLIASARVNALATAGEADWPGVRAVLSSAEPLSPTLRKAVAEAWGCELFDHYGLTESGYGGGVECGARDGYHWREADLWLEIVDPEDGRPVPEGASGEVVITTLNREAMPLIRYRTGDAAALLPGPCRCGSPLRRLGRVSGRFVTDKPGKRRVAAPVKGNAHARHTDRDS